MKTYRMNWTIGSGLAALLNAILAIATLVVAFGFIGPAAMTDNSMLAQLAISDPKPLVIQDLLKFASALGSMLLVVTLSQRLRGNSPTQVRWASALGFLSIFCLMANAGLSLYAISQAANLAHRQFEIGSHWNEIFNQLKILELIIHGFVNQLISLLGIATIAINGLWYLLISWVALKTNQLPKRLSQLGLVIGALSLVPPLGVIVLLLSIAWLAWLSQVLLRGDGPAIKDSITKPVTQKYRYPRATDFVWLILRWAPIAVLLLADVGLLVMLIPGGMTRVRAWSLLQVIPPILGLLVLIGVGLYAAIRRRANKLMIGTLLTALVSIAPLILSFVPVIAYPASITDTTPSAMVRLPANGPLKIIWGGDSLNANRQHVAVPSQRWAYDIAVEPYLTGSARLADYGCYGISVVAPTKGIVVVAHDGEPDVTPGVLSNNFKAPDGNYTALEIETGTYLIIGHLKPNSLTVKVGETVTEGQVIAQCGNSGNTSEPHIHIHHQRQDPRLYPYNQAEGLPLYFRDQSGPAMPQGGLRKGNGTWIAPGDTVQHIGNKWIEITIHD